jgi:hypothetical protein
MLGLDREVDHDRAAIARWCGRLGGSLECDLESAQAAAGRLGRSGLSPHRSAR